MGLITHVGDNKGFKSLIGQRCSLERDKNETLHRFPYIYRYLRDSGRDINQRQFTNFTFLPLHIPSRNAKKKTHR